MFGCFFTLLSSTRLPGHTAKNRRVVGSRVACVSQKTVDGRCMEPIGASVRCDPTALLQIRFENGQPQCPHGLEYLRVGVGLGIPELVENAFQVAEAGRDVRRNGDRGVFFSAAPPSRMKTAVNSRAKSRCFANNFCRRFPSWSSSLTNVTCAQGIRIRPCPLIVGYCSEGVALCLMIVPSFFWYVASRCWSEPSK